MAEAFTGEQMIEPVDAFRGFWDSLPESEQEKFCWIAIQERPYQEQCIMGNATKEQFLSLGIAALDQFAKARAESYEEYRRELMETVKGMTEGLMDGAIHYYLQQNE